MTTYTCKACGAPAKLENGVVVPSCACKLPAFFANLKATAHGEAKVVS